MTFAIPDWYLGLDGYNQEDACRVSLAQPAGDRLHQLNCSDPWLWLTETQTKLNLTLKQLHCCCCFFKWNLFSPSKNTKLKKGSNTLKCEMLKYMWRSAVVIIFLTPWLNTCSQFGFCLVFGVWCDYIIDLVKLCKIVASAKYVMFCLWIMRLGNKLAKQKWSVT